MSNHHLQILHAAGLAQDAEDELAASVLLGLAKPVEKPVVWIFDPTFWERYKILNRPIGSGAFGDVYVGTNPEKKKVAIKILNRVSSSNVDQEISINRAIGKNCSQHIVCYIEHAQINFPIGTTSKRYAIVLNYIDGNDLSDFMEKEDPGSPSGKEFKFFDMDRVEKWFCSALEGLAKLHALNIAHRDIKVENLRVSKVDDKIVYLDLGFGCFTNREPKCQSSLIVGTPCITMSFDAAINFRKTRDGDFLLAEDVYALAQSFYPFFTGFDSPVCELEDLEVQKTGKEFIPVEKVASFVIEVHNKKLFATRQQMLEYVGAERKKLVDVYTKMLSPLAKDRPTAQQAFDQLCKK